MAVGHISVLHVDDDPAITDLAATLLERAGNISVTTVNDPESVPETFASDSFDCIVSDYEMPRLDGLELYAELEDQFEYDDFPFILFTGRGSEAVAADALNAGVTGYLQKGGKEQYELLANRIRNATKQYRAQVRADRYETVIDALGYPVYVVDETGTFRFVNEPFATLTGYDREEILGQPTGFVKPDATVEQAEAELGRVLSASGPDVARFEATIETADGDHVRCRDHMGVLPYSGESFRGSVGILRVLDDAEDRPTEDGDALFDSLPDPTVLAAFDGDGPNIVRHNEAFESVFGDDAVDDVADSPFTADRAVTSREVRRETADGDQREFLFRQVPVGDGRAYGIYTDITARIDYENNLTALHETARELMGATTVEEVLDIGVHATRDILGHEMNAIYRYESSPQRLVPAVATDRTTEILGELPPFTPGDSIGWRAFETGERIVCDDVRGDPDVLNSETVFRSEMLLPLGDRGVLVAGSTRVADFDDGDVSLGRVLAANIQSALAKVEREQTLREREQSLTRQNERLEEFASIVSHDLRTPLDLAGAHLELASEGSHDSDHLSDVAAAHGRMSDLIDDVLTWAREGDAIEATELVSLSALASECWADRQAEAATLNIRTERTVHADRGRLKQVFDNLFDNAIAYAGDEATVTVGDLETDGIFVADDGPGIPEAEREAVFDSGHTLSMEGTGFGLAIVRQIVEAHDWSITVTDSESGGARFEIQF